MFSMEAKMYRNFSEFFKSIKKNEQEQEAKFC